MMPFSQYEPMILLRYLYQKVIRTIFGPRLVVASFGLCIFGEHKKAIITFCSKVRS